MKNIFTKLFHGSSHRGADEKIDRAYVSEFTYFINHYLEDHPEVVEDQETGRYLYWDKTVDFSALKQAEKDAVPENGYGFYSSAWGENRKNGNTPAADPK